MSNLEILPPADAEVFETRIAKIWLQDDGIVRIVVTQQIEGSADDLRELIELVINIGKGKMYPAVIDIRKMRSFPRGARKYFGDINRPRAGLASAYLVQSTLSRLFGNLFISLGKSQIPTKIFTSEKEAIKWLENFKDG